MIEALKIRRSRRCIAALALSAALSTPMVVVAEDDGAMNRIEVVEAVVAKLSGASSAQVILTQSIVGNELLDINGLHRNAITDSFNDSAGVISVNQNSGSIVNQANIRAIAVGKAGLAGAQIAATFEIRDNKLAFVGGERENRLIHSFNNTTGIVGVNQSAGNMNNQANIAAIAIGVGPLDDGFFPLVDASLSVVKSHNDENLDSTIPRRNVRSDSFNNFTGIAQVNQNAGDGNISFQAYILSASGMGLP